MSTGDVTPQEMNFARDYLAGVYPIQSETAEQVAGRILTVAAFDLPADYNSTYPDKNPRRHGGASGRDGAAISFHERFRYGSCRECFRVSRRTEEGVSERAICGDSFDQLDVLAPDLRKAKQ